jgi:hypothetical protein
MFHKIRFNKIKEKFLLILISTAPINVMAHTGHDHGSQWANLIHLLWLTPIAVVAIMLLKFYKNKKLSAKK